MRILRSSEAVASTRRGAHCGGAALVLAATLSLASAACGGDEDVAGSGTGGDQMPDDEAPGPGGPSCPARAILPPGWSPDDVTARSQPATIMRVVALHGEATRDDALSTDAAGRHQAGAPAAIPLTTTPRPFGATTRGPHIHERWGESRKLELSYCITGLIGEDAELQAKYHNMIRSLVDTTTEWERVTGANFVHVVADDTPDQPPHPSPGPNGVTIVRPNCAPGTAAYFGVFTAPLGTTQASTSPVPRAWNDPALEPLGNGILTRAIALNVGLVSVFDDSFLRLVLRHELGHVMGFIHEEVHMPDLDDDDCHTSDPRPLTPVDPHSIMTTPGCDAFSDDAEILTHRDRLSAFFLHHTPRPRFETRVPTMGYRYGGVIGGGAEILWHSEGSTEGILWHPQTIAGALSFVEEPFPYASPETTPPGGWYPNHSEIVIPLRLGAPSSMSLLFYRPGPDVDDLVVFNTGGTATAVPWSHDGFAVPVVGRFDGSDLGRDVVYLYQPGTEDSAVLSADDGVISVVTEVEQQTAFAYPLAAPYRGTTFPDDILWFDPVAGRFISWRLGAGLLDLVETARFDQGGLGLVPGENIPAIGDFNGDGRADVMWQGVSNQAAGFPEIEDALWLSNSTADELAFAVVPKSVGRSHRPFVGDFDGDGIDDVFWHRSWGMTAEGPSAFTTDPSFIWYFDATGAHQTEAFVLDGDYSPYVSDFDADGCHDIAWFDAVADQMQLWRCLPGERDFDCGVTAPTPPNAAPVGMHWGF